MNGQQQQREASFELHSVVGPGEAVGENVDGIACKIFRLRVCDVFDCVGVVFRGAQIGRQAVILYLDVLRKDRDLRGRVASSQRSWQGLRHGSDVDTIDH